MTSVFVFDREINVDIVGFLKKRYVEESNQWFYKRCLEVNKELMGELVIGESELAFFNEVFYLLNVVHLDNYFNKLFNHGVNVIVSELSSGNYIGGIDGDGFYVRLGHVVNLYYNLFGSNRFIYGHLVYTQEYYDAVNIMMKLVYDYSVRVVNDHFSEYSEVLMDMIVKTVNSNIELIEEVCRGKTRIYFDITVIDFKPVIIVRSRKS